MSLKELKESNYSQFITFFNYISYHVHETAKSKGWWDKERNDGECLMLVVTELAEACEALRHESIDDKIPAFLGVEAELADVIIRLMDLSQARGWKVAEAIIEKMKFNETREFKHGGKKF